MGIVYKKKSAQLSDEIGIDEAEALLQWLQANPQATLNLGGCRHVHAAILQILMAAQATVSVWPQDDGLAAWLRSALPTDAV